MVSPCPNGSEDRNRSVGLGRGGEGGGGGKGGADLLQCGNDKWQMDVSVCMYERVTDGCITLCEIGSRAWAPGNEPC